MANATNVYDEPLMLCCGNTGFTREGFCYVPDSDFGNHSVCAIMTDAFLAFSVGRGNDLVTPIPEYSFAGLKAGERWCLCAPRWLEAYQAGVAPLVDLKATHKKALDVIPLSILADYAIESR